MLTVLSENTAIVDEGTHSYLEISWKLDSRFGRACITVGLDPSMYALPPTYKDPISLELTWPPALSLSQPEVVVSENRKKVMLTVHNVDLSVFAKTKGSVQKARIPFEWRDPNRVPSKIEIEIEVESNWSKIDKQTLSGYNVRRSITEFLIHRTDTSFYFPRQSPIFRIPYWDFSRDAALYQQAPSTTVKSITWPTELAYWLSREGEEYLVSQVRKIQRQRPSTIPFRIAICPFELGVEFAVCRNYLREMEVHSRLGVSVSVVSPKAIFQTLDPENSIALYGSSLALHFHGTNSDLASGELFLMFDSHRISDLFREYQEILRLSISWSDYKKRRSLSFSDEESGIWIFNRERYLRLRIEQTQIGPSTLLTAASERLE